jgi:hypothetical protein
MTNDELRALAEKATGGTWYVAGARSTRVHTNCPKIGGYTAVCECEADGDQHLHDARYIAAANPARVLALLNEIERLREALRVKEH